jgi:glycosyl-4,4'-diaponeurosporenoate acyltransferase
MRKLEKSIRGWREVNISPCTWTNDRLADFGDAHLPDALYTCSLSLAECGRSLPSLCWPDRVVLKTAGEFSITDGGRLSDRPPLLLCDLRPIALDAAFPQTGHLARTRGMRWAIILANVCGWPVIQLGVAWCITRLPPHSFTNFGPLERVTSKEAEFYRRRLHIRRWKSMLPDGGQWVGGRFPRKTLEARDSVYLSRFIAETRRGELAHWIMAACCPVFFLWNPVWVWPIMAFYAIASNGPCIVAQRYNRAIVCRLLSRV